MYVYIFHCFRREGSRRTADSEKKGTGSLALHARFTQYPTGKRAESSGGSPEPPRGFRHLSTSSEGHNHIADTCIGPN